MTRKIVDSYCETLPGAVWTDPSTGEHPCWKIGGKMFAMVGHRADGVSVKTPDVETAQLLIEMGRAERAPYFHKSWVRLPWGLVEEAELQERLATSYDLVRGSLTKKVQASLAARPDA